ncbi:MAG: ABC transporter ATP-binding protein, partial [Bosea sp. (in: a-proteobacteria)]
MASSPLLDLSGVSVTLGLKPVVSDASFTSAAGQLVALVGPNGAGKTSLLRAVAGLVPSTGKVHLAGTDVSALSAIERAKNIAYLPQGHQLHWPLTARDVVALGRYPHGASDPTRLSATDAAIVADAMQRTDVARFADRNVQTLSGGERARVMMARVFAVGAQVLLADEPTAALDPRHQLDIMTALKAGAARGALVIAVTHDLGLAARMADQIIVIHEGRIAAIGAPAEVLTADLLREIYGISALHLVQDGEPV